MLLNMGIAAIGLLLTSCAHHKIDVSDAKASKPGVVSVQANWVKDKGKRWDVEFDVTNQHKRGIIILLKEIRCFRGETEGSFKHTFFNTGERTIDFGVNQTKTFRMLCEMGEKAQGDFRILVARVYDNPTNDGKTTGDVLAKDLDWRAPGK